MYQVQLDMGLAEFAVKKAIEELSQTHDTFTYHDIAELIQCNRDTVKKAAQRLLEAGIVIREGSSYRGYRYEIASMEHV